MNVTVTTDDAALVVNTTITTDGANVIVVDYNEGSIDSHSDVDTSAKIDGYILRWNEGVGVWEPSPDQTGAGGTLTINDLDTLAELNSIVQDATLIDTGDARLSDARTPTAHTHTASEVTDFDTEVANNTAVALNTAKTGVTGTELEATDLDSLAKINAIITDATLIDTGDARLSDARTPTSHNHTASEVTDFDTEVSNNTDVALNTAKTGITAQQSSDITTNNSKVSADGSIATHSDVDLTGLVDGYILKYNSTSGNWEPAVDEAGAGGTLTTGDIDTLAELNAIVTDATLIDTADSRLSDARTPTAHNHTASEVTDFDTEVANNTAVALNTAKISYTDASAVALNTTHRTSDGSDHAFIDQDVTSGASPTFNGVNISGITVGATQQLYINVRAGTSTIAIGIPVYISGYNAGGWYTVEPADASNSATMPAAGITTASTPTNATVPLIISGRLTGLDTSSFAQNDSLYVASGGGLTSTKPTGTNAIQKMGSVSRVNVAAGVIIVVGAGRTNDVPNIADGSVWIGNVSGVATPTDLDTLISANSSVSANTSKITFDATASAKVGFISVTQAVDLDTMESNIATNNSKISATGTELEPGDIDTLAELNGIITDATLIDTTDSRLSDARTPTAHTHTASEVTDFDTEVANNTAVALNTAKTGITAQQSSDITTNNAKISFDSTSSTKLGTIETSATADQTGAEIESLLDTELGNTVWGLAATTSTPTTALTLTNPMGIYCNMGTANTNSTFTTSGTTNGAWCKVLINNATRPTVTGGTLITSPAHEVSTNMYMMVEYVPTRGVEYWFVSI